MFTKSDIDFEEIALDPARRRAAIANLSKRRTWLLWLSVISLVLSFGFNLDGRGSSQMIVTMVMMIGLIQFHSEIRLLRVIDRLHKSSDEKLVA
jgi:hypothetical protein